MAPETQVGAADPLAFEFEGRTLRVRTWQGRPCVVARELGAVLGYTDGSRLVDQIRGPWAVEFNEGSDFEKLTNGSIAKFLGADSPDSGESGNLLPGAKSLTILFEPGMYLAAIKSRTPVGRRVRRWLAAEVLPTLARTGRYDRPQLAAPAPQPSAFPEIGNPDDPANAARALMASVLVARHYLADLATRAGATSGFGILNELPERKRRELENVLTRHCIARRCTLGELVETIVRGWLSTVPTPALPSGK